MNQKKVAAWKGSGNCKVCCHHHCCKRECQAHEDRVAALVRKALLLESIRKWGGN